MVSVRAGVWPGVKYIFAAIGGSGSRELIRRLQTRYIVGDKPDRVFFTQLGSVTVDQGRFEDWSGGFVVTSDCSLTDAVSQYCRFLRSHRERTAVFNIAAEQGIFSALGIRDVVFLVRHPLHAYVSWAKPERHGGFLTPWGGVNSLEAVTWYAQRWTSTVNEYLRLSEQGLAPRLIRFEYAPADAGRTSGLGWLFKGFDCTRRNYGVVTIGLEEDMKHIVSASYEEIYGTWFV